MRDWQQIRDAGDIQYAPVPPQEIKVPEPPGWLKKLGEWLSDVLRAIFEPVGQALGLSWPVLQWILIGLAALFVLFIIWRLVEPLIMGPKKPKAEEEPEWVPGREEAIALLEDADRLAAAGKFGEAVHLLLKRSVRHIADARPEWLMPASTAREIALMPMLSDGAQRAFGAIATRVERSVFALRDLDASDWHAAREAYASFALERFADTRQAA
ncbi:MAG: hypothetical protein AB7F98_04220 [Novosphingobium sp.]